MTTTTYELDAILRKVQAMLARADHPNTPAAEAEACRAKADKWMTQYRIDESNLAAGGGLATHEPIWREFVVGSHMSEFRNYYRYMASYVVGYLDVRAVFKYANVNGEPVMVAEMCGYESDLRFAELLVTECLMAFQRRLEPKHDPTLSEQVNAYLMRKAGMEGVRIAGLMYGTTKADPNWKAQCRKVRALFKKEAEARGEDPKPLLGQANNVKTYRQSYAEGFVGELGMRFSMMKLTSKAEGAALVLAGRKEKIDEAFYKRYPQYRPTPSPAQIGDGYDECQKCKRAKSGYCLDHSYRKPTKGKDQPHSRAGYSAGAAAAREVKLEGGG